MKLTVIIEHDHDVFVSHCPELHITSQGDTKEEALAHLKAAVELFLEHADRQEVANRLASGVTISQIEVPYV